VPAHDVLFGASLGQWNGADAADAAGRIRLGTQADRDGLDLFTVADHPYFGGSVQQWIDELTTAVLDHHAAGFIYRNTDDTPADEALARWATEIVPAVREAIAR